MTDPFADFQTIKFINGLTLRVLHWPRRKLQSVAFMINSGSKDDPIGREGVAHFVEHLVSENADCEKDVLMDYALDCGGGTMLGKTGPFFTEYGFSVPAQDAAVGFMLERFASILMYGKLESKIERERSIIMEEFNRAYPYKYLNDILWRKARSLYEGYWLERAFSPLGTPASIRGISQDDLQGYYDTHYNPANMDVVAVGGMEPDRFAALLAESPFGADKKGSRNPTPVREATAPPPTSNGCHLKMSDHIKTGPDFGGVYLSAVRVPGEISANTLGIFYSMLKEILNEEVREKRGWAYAIGCNWEYLGPFYEFVVRCDAYALSAVGKIHQLIEECLKMVTQQQQLFEKVKRRKLSSARMRDWNPSGVLDDVLGDLRHYQQIRGVEEDVQDIASVTMEDIALLGQWLVPERRWTLMMEP